jgi:hypothetical protein
MNRETREGWGWEDKKKRAMNGEFDQCTLYACMEM